VSISEAEKRAKTVYRKKCIVHAVQVNPQTEPLAATRLAALKKAGQATAFFKDALVEYKTEERSEFFTVAKCEGGDK